MLRISVLPRPAPVAANQRSHDTSPAESKGYRSFLVACAVAFVLIGALNMVASPRADRVTAALMIVAVSLVLTRIVYRPGPRQAILAAAFLDVFGLAESVRAPAGIAEALLFPLLGGLLLVAAHRGRTLLIGFGFAWLSGVVGVGLSFAFGAMARHAAETYPPTTIAFAGVLGIVTYATMWWVANRWQAALDGAHLAEERYRTLFERATDAIAVLSKDTVVDANPACCSLLGYTIEELRGMPTDEILMPSAMDDYRHDRARMSAGSPVFVERPLRRKDGSTVIVEVSGQRLPNGTSQVAMRDVTARRAAQAERDRLAAAVDQAADIVIVIDAAGVIDYVSYLPKPFSRAAHAQAVRSTLDAAA